MYIKLRSLQNEKLSGMKITHLPINCNISTTGHKLQGRTMNSLVVNSWGYRYPHWVYVVLSRVTTLKGLILNEKLDEDRNYEANQELCRWEADIKKRCETATFRSRGEEDLQKYLEEELKYNFN